MLTIMLAAIDIETILQIGVFLFIIISTLAGQFFTKNNPRRPAKKPRPASPDARSKQTQLDRSPQAAQDKRWNEPIDVSLQREPYLAEPILAEPVHAQIVPVEPAVARESVAEHVQRHIESGGIESDRLHSDVERADERMASHLQEAFDHRLGRLDQKDAVTSDASTRSGKKTTEAEPPAAQDIAQRIAQMMRTPADLSAAIVLNEILKRPEERWSE